jgi:hypothetical protein
MSSSDKIDILHCAINSFQQHVPHVLGILPILLSHEFNEDCHRYKLLNARMPEFRPTCDRENGVLEIARGGQQRTQLKPFQVWLNRFRSKGGKKSPDVDPDDETHVKTLRNTVARNLEVRVIALLAMMFLISRVLFSVSPQALNYIDKSARNFWLQAERVGIIEPFHNFSLEYRKQFPEFRLLEEKWQIIRDEAAELLATKRKSIPRLKDLYVEDPDRASGKVYETDWKTCELCTKFRLRKKSLFFTVCSKVFSHSCPCVSSLVQNGCLDAGKRSVSS